MLEITIEELQALLVEQKRVTAEYITGNLSSYVWYNREPYDLKEAKEQLKARCLMSGYPNDFDVLKKYLKPQ